MAIKVLKMINNDDKIFIKMIIKIHKMTLEMTIKILKMNQNEPKIHQNTAQ